MTPHPRTPKPSINSIIFWSVVAIIGVNALNFLHANGAIH